MGLGMPEVVLILVIALIVFGPRKLPELGKSLGQAMSQFRKASDDFKRTWEQEVESEKVRTPDTSSSSSNTGYDYHANNETYDPYNSYANEPETAQATNSATGTEPKALNAPDTAVATAEAAVAATGAKPEKKHWI